MTGTGQLYRREQPEAARGAGDERDRMVFHAGDTSRAGILKTSMRRLLLVLGYVLLAGFLVYGPQSSFWAICRSISSGYAA